MAEPSQDHQHPRGPQALCVPELVATALLGGEPLTLIWGKKDNFGVKPENADF